MEVELSDGQRGLSSLPLYGRCSAMAAIRITVLCAIITKLRSKCAC